MFDRIALLEYYQYSHIRSGTATTGSVQVPTSLILQFVVRGRNSRMFAALKTDIIARGHPFTPAFKYI